MLCSVCSAIDFRPLNEWSLSEEELVDETNRAFHMNWTSDDAAKKWRDGEGMLHVFYMHHQSATCLLLSAQNGCILCAMIAFALFQQDVRLTALEHLSLPAKPRCDKPIVLSLFLKVGCLSWRRADRGEHIYVFCGSAFGRLNSLEAYTEHPIRNDLYGEMFYGVEMAWRCGDMRSYLSTWSGVNIDLAKIWYHSCIANHGSCAHTNSILPKRVIDVRKFGIRDQPLLIEHEEEKSDRYVTLSHCWGDNVPLTITPTASKGVWALPPLMAWPQVFQDAVTVTREFDIQYLWIDSPCILQGNLNDWEVESGKMAQYFQNSAFTIAALNSGSRNQSLFAFRNPLMSYPFRLQLPSTVEDDTCFERFLLAQPVDTNLADHRTRPTESPLHSRAWILQEELLSLRILQFGECGLYWHCRTGHQSESLLTDPNMALPREQAAPLQIAISSPHQGWVRRPNPYHDAWYDILRRFNSRNITYLSDVLPSLSGVAEIMHRSLLPNDTYIAGIWLLDLTIGLLWCRVPGLDSDRVPVPKHRRNFDRTEFYAPSWSWVSQAHNSLNFHLHPKIQTPNGTLLWQETESGCHSVNIHVRNEASPYGNVKSAMLNFRAKCHEIIIFLDKAPSQTPRGDIANLELRGTSKGNIPYKHIELANDSFAQSAALLGLGSMYGDCILDEDEPSIRQKSGLLDILPWLRSSVRCIKALFLPLLTYHTEVNSMPDRTLGLAIVKVTGADAPQDCSDLSDKQTYRRIGRAALNRGPGLLYHDSVPFYDVSII